MFTRHASGRLLDRYRDEIEELAGGETPFDDVEDALDETDLTPDQKAALWMLAWSLIGPRPNVRDARAMLRLLVDGADLDELADAGRRATVAVRERATAGG